MQDLTKVLSGSEKAVYALRSLYTDYGYEQYKMSKFEEYDLYVRNKDYLISDAVITFTDTDGKLLALKPDVTLSIIKNSKDEPTDLKKVCYAENVYRPSKGTRSFKEIMQVGLECQGDIDDYVIYEVLLLASKSLGCITEDYALDISHLGLVSSVMNELGVSKSAEKEILVALGEKNVQAVEIICKRENADFSATETLIQLATVYGRASVVLEKLKKLCLSDTAKESLKQLENLFSQLVKVIPEEKLNLDFSVINDMNYYNGIVFKGFVSGVPTGILSGGQYDNLMQKMGKKSGAIGFAVYLDELEKLSYSNDEYDVDVVVLYGAETPLEMVVDTVKKITDGGETVVAVKGSPKKIRYKRLIKV